MPLHDATVIGRLIKLIMHICSKTQASQFQSLLGNNTMLRYSENDGQKSCAM